MSESDKNPKNISDLISELVIRKEKRLLNMHTTIKRAGGIKESDPFKMLEEENSGYKIQTGTLLDELLGGGLLPQTSMLLYGEYASGKTQTCYTMVARCPDHIVYIDVENSFKMKRLKQICDSLGIDYTAVFKKLHIFKPKNWIELMWVISSLPTPQDIDDGKIGLYVLDSLTKHFRGIEFSGRQTLSVKQPLLREMILSLEDMSKTYDAAFIYTTQIYESPSTNAFMPDWANQEPVGGSSILHQPDYVVFLRKAQGNVRIARLMDSSWNEIGERPFRITAKGIENLLESEKAEELIEKSEKWSVGQLDPLRDKGKRGRPPKEETPESTTPAAVVPEDLTSNEQI